MITALVLLAIAQPVGLWLALRMVRHTAYTHTFPLPPRVPQEFRAGAWKPTS